jgi:hypothetical protein
MTAQTNESDIICELVLEGRLVRVDEKCFTREEAMSILTQLPALIAQMPVEPQGEP